MNIPPIPTPTAATTSLAGVSRAAARGGEHESRVGEAARQQRVSEAPAGKVAGSDSIDASDATGDRDGDGRQTYDLFDKHEQPNPDPDVENASESETSSIETTEESAQHIDFEA